MSPPESPPAIAVAQGAESTFRLPKRTLFARLREYFMGEDPTLLSAVVPMCLLSMVLYTRHPATNFIFDEQEALLANPYVRAAADRTAKIGWLAAFRRDFWGLTPDHTIGSYRPLPDIVWRAMWKIGMRDQSAFPHDYLNVLIHGLNGGLVVLLVFRWTRDRLTAWLAGSVFVATAIVTEAVSGVVGLADVLGGTGAVLALLALGLRLSTMPIALAAATLFGLYSKESALSVVPLVPLAALFTSQITHQQRPMRLVRAIVAGAATGAAFVFYVEMRRRWFPVAVPHDLTVTANAGKPLAKRAFAAALRWYAQPMLPHDPLNNPLIEASTRYRIAGALRVYTRGLEQVVFPSTLSGDYSAPQEPIPARLLFPESIFGALAMTLPLLVAPILAIGAWLRWRRQKRRGWTPIDGSLMVPVNPIDRAPVLAFALVWIVVCYLPVSNIPVVLPTVRAERFWYLPAIGTSIVIASTCAKVLSACRPFRIAHSAVGAAVVLFLGVQCFAARRHALDYTNDLAFWSATRKAAPNSAKAHLNYSVMLGARGDLEGRLVANEVALRLAPQWPMANVYEGDTLCRLHRAPEALPHYLRGFRLGTNDLGLIALGLQCLWDEKMLEDDSTARDELRDVAEEYPGSWLKYLVDDTLSNGVEYKGVNPKYRPRGYNEGPKKEE